MDGRRDETFVDLVRGHASRRPCHPALIVEEKTGEWRTVTYAQLDVWAADVASGLVARYSPGERALVLHTTTASFAVGLLACLYAGLIPVPAPLPLGPTYQQQRVQGMLADCDAALVIVDSLAAQATSDWAMGLRRADGSTVAVETLSGSRTANTQDAEQMLRPSLSDIALLQYTSGSTSHPRGVIVTHGNIKHHHDTFVTELGLTSADIFCSWLPGYHDFGLIGMLLVPLGLGATTVLISSISFVKRPAHWLQVLDQFKATVTASPNFGYEHCVRRISDDQIKGLDLSHLRWTLNGAEPIDASTLEDFTNRFKEIGFRNSAHGPGYGLAEATLTVSYPQSRRPIIVTVDSNALSMGQLKPIDLTPTGLRDKTATRLVSCGAPQGVEIRLADSAGNVAPPGAVGEIWLRGSSIATGYWGKHNVSATAETFRVFGPDGSGPWMKTGDLAAHYNGEIVITGRIKEMLLVAGRNLYPYDLERDLRNLHEGSVGRPGAVFEAANVPGALCAVQEFRSVSTSELGTAEDDLKAVVQRMASYLAGVSGAAVHDVVLVRPGQVPRTTSGKIQRRRARDLLGDGRLAEVYSLSATRQHMKNDQAGN
jgi:acyl-CoA synthetase (AMP-forming)/AMP-acid ligase II